jgi:pilus assembly protein CpaE
LAAIIEMALKRAEVRDPELLLLGVSLVAREIIPGEYASAIVIKAMEELQTAAGQPEAFSDPRSRCLIRHRCLKCGGKHRGTLFLTSIVISPQADRSGELSTTLNEFGHVCVRRSFQQYRSEGELGRLLKMIGQAIVVLSSENTRRALELALAMDRAGIGTQVVALSSACDPQVLDESMQVGIREVISPRLDPDRLKEAVWRITEELERKPLAFRTTDGVFSFLAAKPGDGASTVALNVSSAIARLSRGKTLLADFDLNMGMVAFLMKITNGHSVLDAIDVADRLDDALWNNLVLKRDMDLLCFGRLEPRTEVDPSATEKTLHCARRSYSTICLDLSGNMEPFSMTLLGQSREIFLVCTSYIPSLHFARVKAHFLQDFGFANRSSVVINRSDTLNVFSTEELETLLGLRIRLSLQNDPRRVSSAMRPVRNVRGKPAQPRFPFNSVETQAALFGVLRNSSVRPSGHRGDVKLKRFKFTSGDAPRSKELS